MAHNMIEVKTRVMADCRGQRQKADSSRHLGYGYAGQVSLILIVRPSLGGTALL